MAALDQLKNISNQIIQETQGAQQRQQQGIQDIKTKQGFDDRLKTLENLRRSVYDTEKVLSQLPRDVQGRTRGRLITAGQQNRLLSKEREPLATTLANLSRSTDVEQQGVNQVRGLIDDYLKQNMSDTDARLRALALQREDAGRAFDLELDRERRSQQERMQQAQMALQRSLAAMNRPSYDLGFLQNYIDSRRQVPPTVQQVQSTSNNGLIGNLVNNIGRTFTTGLPSLISKLSANRKF